MEAPPGIEPGMELLQSSALPLGDGALRKFEVKGQKSEVWNLLTQPTSPVGAATTAFDETERHAHKSLRPTALPPPYVPTEQGSH